MEEFSDKNSYDFIAWLNRQWEFSFKKQRPDIGIEGSPERTVSRMVVQDQSDELFLIEKFSNPKFELRQTVARTVHYLNQQGLDQALGYQQTVNGEFLPHRGDSFFGLSPFVKGTPLVRPDYLKSDKMGENFAGFLKKMVMVSAGINTEIPLKIFSIKDYIYTLFAQMKQFDIKAFETFSPFLEFLENQFMEVHDHLPVGFCHGDLHPLNVIWDGELIRAVIDWEFLGIKPQIYDAANLVGCAGIENPQGLAMPMVKRFLHELHDTFDPSGWHMFPEYVMALRFAWLSEWLRKKDHEMIEMEAAFMGILVDNMDQLRQIWKIE